MLRIMSTQKEVTGRIKVQFERFMIMVKIKASCYRDSVDNIVYRYPLPRFTVNSKKLALWCF
jgi:hypothetical protein